MHVGKEDLESSWMLVRNQLSVHRGRGKWPGCQQLWIEMADSGLAVADNVFSGQCVEGESSGGF